MILFFLFPHLIDRVHQRTTGRTRSSEFSREKKRENEKNKTLKKYKRTKMHDIPKISRWSAAAAFPAAADWIIQKLGLWYFPLKTLPSKRCIYNNRLNNSNGSRQCFSFLPSMHRLSVGCYISISSVLECRRRVGGGGVCVLVLNDTLRRRESECIDCNSFPFSPSIDLLQMVCATVGISINISYTFWSVSRSLNPVKEYNGVGRKNW